MCTWEIHREKRPTPQGGLELRFKYHLIGKGGRVSALMGGRVNDTRKDEWALRGIHGREEVCNKACLGVASTSSLLFCEKSQSSLVGETPREGICDN